LASDLWPPFTNISDQPRLAIDLAHEALHRADIEATTSIVEFGAVILGLQDGRFDGSGALWRTPERESFLIFSEPYLENRLVLVGRAGSDVSAARLSDLIGKRVAVVGSYAYGETVKNATETLFIKGQNEQENLQKLLAGEVDFMLVDELLIRYVLQHQENDAGKYLQIGTTPLVRRTLHFVVRKAIPDSAAIIEKFDSEIKNMLADGTYNKILRLNWIRADVDGDGQTELVPMNPRAARIPPATGYAILDLDPAEPPADESDRYWIDGQAYEGWDNVPKRYKLPEEVFQEPDIPKPFLYKFTF
jgi:ABC-type amino acid transport substrate-binding protein